MTPTEFIALVQDLRNTQKSYFATRNKGALIRSKELEKKVDQIIADPHLYITNV